MNMSLPFNVHSKAFLYSHGPQDIPFTVRREFFYNQLEGLYYESIGLCYSL
jgi:hypothetical protein